MEKNIIQIIFIMFLSLLIMASQKNEKSYKTSSLRLTQLAGKQLFELKDCISCHNDKNENSTAIMGKREGDWFSEHISAESEIVIGEGKSERRKRKYLKKEVAALDDFLFNIKKSDQESIGSLPANLIEGAYLAYQNNCIGCHAIAGQGKDSAPVLTFVADKRSEKSWHIANLKNPLQFAPESNMPAFEDRLSESSLGKLADYLLTLKK